MEKFIKRFRAVPKLWQSYALFVCIFIVLSILQLMLGIDFSESSTSVRIMDAIVETVINNILTVFLLRRKLDAIREPTKEEIEALREIEMQLSVGERTYLRDNPIYQALKNADL